MLGRDNGAHCHLSKREPSVYPACLPWTLREFSLAWHDDAIQCVPAPLPPALYRGSRILIAVDA